MLGDLLRLDTSGYKRPRYYLELRSRDLSTVSSLGDVICVSKCDLRFAGKNRVCLKWMFYEGIHVHTNETVI